MKNVEKWAITDLNAPNGSRDIPFQSQEFGQDRYRHFVSFQPHFELNMTSQTQYCKTRKKWKCNVSGVFFLICLKLCRLLELGKGILLHFKILLLWQPESKLLSIIEKTKGLLFKQKWCLKSKLKQYSLIAAASGIKCWRKMGDYNLLIVRKQWSFVFEKRLIILVWVAIATKLKSSEIHSFTSNSLQNFKQIKQR